FEEAIIETPPSIGFEGNETLGSSRGYIWSRSLPMLKDTMLLGYGPDMFMLEFPQYDFWGKWNSLTSPFQGVDKPHNTYLQIWINQGFPAFLAFVVLCATYIIHCFKLYAFKKVYSSDEGMGLAFMLAIVGYLGASFFNDTTLSVTPLFWALLGAGMAYNVIYKTKSASITEEISNV
ncbi:MAG: O-antigen ligase family protein, partial [Niameybacter sp.]